MKRLHLASLLIFSAIGACTSQPQSPSARPAQAAPPSAANADDRDATAPAAEPGAAQSLERLMAGNKRFVSGHPLHPHDSTGRRGELTAGQHPYAIVLGCSDSRVPPPIVFDAGLGDLFEVRVAGNSAEDPAIASIEYAAEHLHVPLLVVLGHEKCGAVAATIATVQSGDKPPGHLSAVIDPIRPAVEKAKGEPGDLESNSITENVKHAVEQLEHSDPVLAEMVHSGHLKIVGAVYHLGTGEVVMTGAE
jgi:carbonic anhydrase